MEPYGNAQKGKRYTLLLLNPHGRALKLRLPKCSLYVLVVFTIIGLVTLTVLAESYARMLVKVSNYNHLRADRETLQTKYRLLETAVNHTDTQLRSLESLASEVAVSYGFGKTLPSTFTHANPATSQSDPDLDTTYNASLYTFNQIQGAFSFPPRNLPLFSLLSNPAMRPSDIPSIWPVHGEVTGGFGERMDPFSGEGQEFHPGLDIAVPLGTPVHASADGIVLRAGADDPGYGNEIIIDHGSGIETQYGHLRRIFVIEGQEVKQGQVIGSVGMTGRTTGPHLHYGVLVHDTPVNPEKFLRG